MTEASHRAGPPSDKQWRYYADLCIRAKIAPIAQDSISAAKCAQEIDRLKPAPRVSYRRSRGRNRNTFGYSRGKMY